MKGSASFSIQPSHDTRFSAFPVGALGVSNKDFIALLFLGEGLGEERSRSHPPMRLSFFSQILWNTLSLACSEEPG